MLTLTGAVINGVQTTMYALAAHVYPSSGAVDGRRHGRGVRPERRVLTGYVGHVGD